MYVDGSLVFLLMRTEASFCNLGPDGGLNLIGDSNGFESSKGEIS